MDSSLPATARAGERPVSQGYANYVLAVLFVVPLIALATARFYVELRLSAEGLDVTIDAAAAFDHSSRVVR